MGIGEFEVRAGKEGTGDVPASRTAVKLAVGGGPWRHFVCVVPSGFGLESPIQFNTLEMADFSRFRLMVSLPDLKLPDGLSFGGGIEFCADAGQVIHPERLSDQPFLASLRAGVEALSLCIARRLDHAGFLQALNAASLPILWRNELADGVFMPAPATLTSNPTLPSAGEDDIDALLSSISDPSGKPMPTAADRFAAEIGETESTGFILNESEARRFHSGLTELLRDLEAGIFSHRLVEASIGFILALHSLVKLARGPRHIHFHILPSGMAEAGGAAYWDATMAEHPGRIEAGIYLAATRPESDGWIGAWGKFFQKNGVSGFIQAGQDSMAWLEWGKGRSSTFVFSGGVAVALGDGRFFLKPAALAYFEALLKNQAELPAAAGESLSLDDQDVWPASRSSADTVYDGEAMEKLRSLGLNVPVGAKNRSGIQFRSLVRNSGPEKS